jgi:AcrR family transcriptional regulator
MRPKNPAKEEAIRQTALRIIAEEGLENLTMQKLATAANISPRTIYIKYADKEDLLIKLFVDDVLGAYEQATLVDFEETMSFETGIQKVWSNVFDFFKANRPAFVLAQYGKTSPLLNKAFQERNIGEGTFFTPLHRFLKRHAVAGTIPKLPPEAYRSLLFAPVLDLVHEYYEFVDRPKQVITDKVLRDCCRIVVKGMLL